MDDQTLITTEAQLREIVGEVPDPPKYKTIDHIDDICRRYIAAAPFLVIGTTGADGLMDLSPKGDPAGFVRVLDRKTLAIPERLGNGRFDSYVNIMHDPRVALIFLIPGHRDTLRVAGQARISRDPGLLADGSVRGREPRFTLLVTVEEAMTHCSKCMVRSGLWEQERWPDTSDLPTLAEAMVVHGALPISTERMNEIIVNDGRDRLY